MRLGELQHLLAALYVSSEERKAWYLNAESVEHDYGLDETARTALRGLGHAPLELYASELQHKRFAEIMKLMPFLAVRHQRFLWQAFTRYAANHLPVGPKKHIADLLAFGRFLSSAKETLSTDALNLLRFELVPWMLNFKLQEQQLTLPASKVSMCLIQAHRIRGLTSQTRRFKGYLPSLLDRMKTARTTETPTRQGRINSLGIFLKPPGVSWHFEWYVPWP